jgi:preprotein translocase subunit SecE
MTPPMMPRGSTAAQMRVAAACGGNGLEEMAKADKSKAKGDKPKAKGDAKAKGDTKAKGKQKSKSKGSSAKADKPNLVVRFGRYLRDVWAELKRVVWPTRPEVINSSLVVIVTIIFFVAFTFVVDNLSIQAVRWIAQIGG